MIRLNLGCGMKYMPGWINIDNNPAVKADVYCDISNELPFDDNTFDFILASHIIEHVPREKLYKLLEELHRISKPGAIIKVKVPHFSSCIALSCPYHTTYWGIDSFKTFEPVTNQNEERYSTARFKVISQKLKFVFDEYENYSFLSFFKFLNPLFNLSKFWQRVCERTWLWGFDEIVYILSVQKEKAK